MTESQTAENFGMDRFRAAIANAKLRRRRNRFYDRHIAPLARSPRKGECEATWRFHNRKIERVGLRLQRGRHWWLGNGPNIGKILRAAVRLGTSTKV